MILSIHKSSILVAQMKVNKSSQHRTGTFAFKSSIPILKNLSSIGLTEAIVQEDLLRKATTKSLILSSQDDLNIQTELRQHTASDDSNDATAEDTLIDATDQTPTDSSDDDTNQNTSDQGTSADDTDNDGTSSGTEQHESDEGTPESSSETSAVSDNQIELPEQIELRDTTIGKLFDGSNSLFKITVHCYIDGSEIEKLRLIYDDVQLTSRE